MFCVDFWKSEGGIMKHYVDNENGTVTDTKTGLMWLQDGNDYNGGKEQTWKDAVSG